MPFINIDGVFKINLVRTGPNGKPLVVFLHPAGLDLTWWSEQFEEFGQKYDVVAFDMLGHGLSEKLKASPSLEYMADILEGVLAHVNGGPAHLVGMSIGGMIAQILALKRPDLIRSLCLVATLCTFPGGVREVLRERARVARAYGMAKIAQLSNERWFPPSFRERRPDILDRTTKSLLLQDPDFHASMWEMVSELDLEGCLSSVACPTLVVAGAEDLNAPATAGELIASCIPNASLTTMAGVGHFPAVEEPQLFNSLLKRWLDDQSRS